MGSLTPTEDLAVLGRLLQLNEGICEITPGQRVLSELGVWSDLEGFGIERIALPPARPNAVLLECVWSWPGRIIHREEVRLPKV
ncbi:MAG TPA: hypothetical protein VEH28_08575, partial [Thermoplasmata archaeon]|nr:hypothetical protein [Thermoplasmata archaeon]